MSKIKDSIIGVPVNNTDYDFVKKELGGDYEEENNCEKCGEETSDRLVGDEVATYCNNCNN